MKTAICSAIINIPKSGPGRLIKADFCCQFSNQTVAKESIDTDFWTRATVHLDHDGKLSTLSPSSGISQQECKTLEFNLALSFGCHPTWETGGTNCSIFCCSSVIGTYFDRWVNINQYWEHYQTWPPTISFAVPSSHLITDQRTLEQNNKSITVSLYFRESFAS